jgi:hypothetical protein
MEDWNLDSFDFMDKLPILQDLVICREQSSHDRKGGNDNGFSNRSEFVRRERGARVVSLDAAGPGCVYSIWYTWPNHPMYGKRVERAWAGWLKKIKFYFNGEHEPRLDTPLRHFVGPEPFTYPLAVHAKESTGGYNSYVPLPFQDGLKVTVDRGGIPMFGMHFWYHCYPHGTKVETWSENMDLAAAAAKLDPEAAWQPADQDIHEMNDVVIGPEQTTDVLKSEQGGTINCIRMMLPEDDAVLKALWLKAWWDDDEEPSIEAPLSLLFAIEHRYSEKKAAINKNAEMRGVNIGRDREGMFYLRLPMPFARSARLAVENRGDHEVVITKVRIESDEVAPPGLGKSAGYLRTVFRQSGELTPGRDYLLAHIKGRGKIVGTVLAVEDTAETFLEGDERIYIDGCRSPHIIGDATETYFNGSWYFCESAFACPLHGAPTFRMKRKVAGDPSDVTMYRFHPTDFVPFRGAARFSMQHGGFNEVPGNYRSLVFYYHLQKESLVRTDHIDMTDSNDLEAHQFSGAAPARIKKRHGFFEGDWNGQDLGLKKRPGWLPPILWMLFLTVRSAFHNPPKDSQYKVSFIVAEHKEPYEFTAKIDPNAEAVMIRRVLDQSIFDQRAAIEVDGRTAGLWYNTGNNKWKIFAEDDIILDPSATRGKSEIKIRVAPESGPFTAAEYTVFSIITPD